MAQEEVKGFNLRLTLVEREAVRVMAKRERRSDTAMIRQAIAEAAERRGVPILPSTDQEAA
jgi:hypothetical protein